MDKEIPNFPSVLITSCLWISSNLIFIRNIECCYSYFYHYKPHPKFYINYVHPYNIWKLCSALIINALGNYSPAENLRQLVRNHRMINIFHWKHINKIWHVFFCLALRSHLEVLIWKKQLLQNMKNDKYWWDKGWIIYILKSVKVGEWKQCVKWSMKCELKSPVKHKICTIKMIRYWLQTKNKQVQIVCWGKNVNIILEIETWKKP